jgi:predicted metalloprotease
MRWEGEQESGNVEDRRTFGGKTGLAVGGGAALLIMLVGALLGIDPGQLKQFLGNPANQGGDGGQAQQRELTPQEERSRKFASTILRFTEEVWDEQFTKAGKRYQAPHMVLFYNQVETGCGVAPSAVGPFYCPADKTVYLDPTFFDELERKLGGSKAEFSQAYVIAHEVGHHVQNLQGTLGRAQQGAQGPTGSGVRTELQADCYAGIWAHYAAITKQEGTDVPFLEPLSDKDIADALSAASAVGDDRIQASATGRINPESWTHGSSEQRQKWFTVGYQTGDPNKCDTFATRDLG